MTLCLRGVGVYIIRDANGVVVARAGSITGITLAVRRLLIDAIRLEVRRPYTVEEVDNGLDESHPQQNVAGSAER
jgi:hypothetical protein